MRTRYIYRKVIFLTGGIAAAVLIQSIPLAQAIPAFVRKYGLSCTTCHDPFPRLKAYGEDFAGNGFALPDKEEPPRAYRDTGDERLLLQRDLPLAFRFDAYTTTTPDDPNVKNDFKYPWGLKILSGGNITKKVGYYLYFFFSERGEVAGIEDAYVHFNNLGGTEFDIMLGQFQISDPLMKRELRLTFEDYQFYKTRVGLSRANLTYDRGIMATYSLSSGTDFAFQVVNGNGKDKSADNKNFDVDSDKAFFFRVLQSYKLLNFGGFTYYGKEKLTGVKNEFYYLGPDIAIASEKAQLNFQYIRRHDTNSFFVTGSGLESESESVIGEFVATPKDYLYTVILYNKIWSNRAFVPEYETANVNVTYLHNTNLKFFTEYQYDLEEENSRFVLGLVTGF